MNGVKLFSSSMVTDYAMLLFGGGLERAEHGLTMVGKTLRFRMDPNVREMLLWLQNQLTVLLKSKIENPSIDVMEAAGPLVGVVSQLLINDNGPVADDRIGKKALRNLKWQQQAAQSHEFSGMNYYDDEEDEEDEDEMDDDDAGWGRR